MSETSRWWGGIGINTFVLPAVAAPLSESVSNIYIFFYTSQAKFIQIVVGWKHQDLSEVLDNAFTKVYNPCESLDWDEIVLFIRRSVSSQLP